MKIISQGAHLMDEKLPDGPDSSVIRKSEHPELPQPIPGLLEGYVTLLAGAGGVGKTYLVEQILWHLGGGVQIGRFPLPENNWEIMALYLEDVRSMTQSRSFDVAPLGTVEQDKWEPGDPRHNIRYYYDIRGVTGLEHQLELRKERGLRPVQMIIIDYFDLFVGSQPSGISQVDWERRNMVKIRELAVKYDVHILVLTHMNKQGQVGGTTAMRNAVDTLYVIEPNDDRMSAVLKCEKMRVAPQTDYCLTRRWNGTWGFDDQAYLSESMVDGIGREILKVLRDRGMQTLNQLCKPDMPINGTRDGIRQALTRMRKKGYVANECSHWKMIPTRGDEALRELICAACNTRMAYDDGSGMHPTCAPATEDAAMAVAYNVGIKAADAVLDRYYDQHTEPEPVPECMVPVMKAAAQILIREAEDPGYLEDAAAGEEPADEPEPTPEEEKSFNGYASARRSVKASRYHPISVIPKEDRDREPWTLIRERTGGEPSWVTQEAPECTVCGALRWEWNDKPRKLGQGPCSHGVLVTLDRNGSFPSACSSVPLAPNKLLHTGPMACEESKDRAGIFLINQPEWDTGVLPHPLGAIVKQAEADEPVWVSTPHLRMLIKRNLTSTILDSWTGKRNDSLLYGFYQDARKARAELVGTGEPYQWYKRSVSKALRALWPKEDPRTGKDTPSPFWRPDWRVSMVAEASVRHWSQAMAAHHQDPNVFLVALRNSDEAVFWTPAGSVPSTYVEGNWFGQVKVKRLAD